MSWDEIRASSSSGQVSWSNILVTSGRKIHSAAELNEPSCSVARRDPKRCNQLADNLQPPTYGGEMQCLKSVWVVKKIRQIPSLSGCIWWADPASTFQSSHMYRSHLEQDFPISFWPLHCLVGLLFEQLNRSAGIVHKLPAKVLVPGLPHSTDRKTILGSNFYFDLPGERNVV